MDTSFYLVGHKSFWALVIVIFARYALFATLAFTLFYVIRREAWRFKKIQLKFPLRRDYARELLYSITTTFIFAAVGYVVFATPFSKFTKMYYDLGEHRIT
ncbi:MAG: hypothetical protein ACOYXT_21725 [Bacteroidota bacterium]